MLTPEKVFDDLYEYVDLWSGGYVKAHLNGVDTETFMRVKHRLVESIMDRIGVVNRLRKAMNLGEMTIDEAYDYYINNMPEFDDKTNSVDLRNYDADTSKLALHEDNFARKDKPCVKSMLTVMGAPEVYIENSHIIQERIDHINRLLHEGGYPNMDARKTEEMLVKLLIVNNV